MDSSWLEDLNQRRGENVLKSIRRWFKTFITSGIYSEYITCQGVYANKCLKIHGSGCICVLGDPTSETGIWGLGFCFWFFFAFCWWKKTRQKKVFYYSPRHRSAVTVHKTSNTFSSSHNIFVWQGSGLYRNTFKYYSALFFQHYSWYPNPGGNKS